MSSLNSECNPYTYTDRTSLSEFKEGKIKGMEVNGRQRGLLKINLASPVCWNKFLDAKDTIHQITLHLEDSLAQEVIDV